MQYNPEDYCDFNSQGQIVDVSKLTLEELQQALCRGIEHIEKLDEICQGIANEVENWRKSK